jgi:hypothetical protein
VTRPRRTAKPAGESLVFRGPPGRLASLLPAPGAAEQVAKEPTASLSGADVRGLTVRTFARAGVDARKVTLRVPTSTAPGIYRGSAEIEGQEIPIVVEVEPRPRLEADPRRISIEATPGDTATVDVTLLNTGNVPCDVSETTTFCLFDGRGMEHAFWQALTDDPPEGKQRIDVLLDDLAESHGGLVTTTVENGADIGVGETREVTLRLRFSDRLRPGKRYAGSWRADGLRISVRVTTPAAKPRRVARAT